MVDSQNVMGKMVANCYGHKANVVKFAAILRKS